MSQQIMRFSEPNSEKRRKREIKYADNYHKQTSTLRKQIHL